MSLDLERFRVGTLPSLYYIPEAIGAEEEQRLLREIRASKQAWKTVSGKRQGCAGGSGACDARRASWRIDAAGLGSAYSASCGLNKARVPDPG